MEIDYELKYLKYKQKYLDLKNIENEQEGGFALPGYYYIFFSKKSLENQIGINAENSNLKTFGEKLLNDTYNSNNSIPSYDEIAKILNAGYYLKNDTAKLLSVGLNTVSAQIAMTLLPKRYYKDIAKGVDYMFTKNNGTPPNFTEEQIGTMIRDLNKLSELTLNKNIKLNKLDYNTFSDNDYDTDSFKQKLTNNVEPVKEIINQLREKRKTTFDSCILF
jgi:hypothetical protein